jgi:sugar O-acyltransferase (sialic acid O-acetyltransferase NeuD family)
MSYETPKKILIIGGGRGAYQVLDILSSMGEPDIIAGIVDDDPDKLETKIWGVPVIGDMCMLGAMYEEKEFTHAIIAISSSIAVRYKLFKQCKKLGIPMANAIDPTAKIAYGAKIGEGNVICAFCQIGAMTNVGDNNFFSAYTSFDHHCNIGSHISTGPGCISSGIVNVGDRVRMACGVFIEPYLTIGNGALLSSGAIVKHDVEPAAKVYPNDSMHECRRASSGN